MNPESIDRNNEPTTDEFEKLEFLPEQPVDDHPDPDDTAEIIFTPEESGANAVDTNEPPVSFGPAGDEGDDLVFDPAPLPDRPDAMPFELFGTSLFDDADFDEDLDSLESEDLDDDLEF